MTPRIERRKKDKVSHYSVTFDSLGGAIDDWLLIVDPRPEEAEAAMTLALQGERGGWAARPTIALTGWAKSNATARFFASRSIAPVALDAAPEEMRAHARELAEEGRRFRDELIKRLKAAHKRAYTPAMLDGFNRRSGEAFTALVPRVLRGEIAPDGAQSEWLRTLCRMLRQEYDEHTLREIAVGGARADARAVDAGPRALSARRSLDRFIARKASLARRLRKEVP